MELQERVSKARQSTNQNSYTREGLINQSDARMDPSSQSETVFHPTGQVSSPFGQSEVVLDSSGVEVDQSASLTDRIVERCRHKSGRVDSKRVLDILKQEDGKHNKVLPICHISDPTFALLLTSTASLLKGRLY